MGNKNFKENFLNEGKGKAGKINVLTFFYETQKNIPHIKMFCFVEGPTDQKFYKGVIERNYGLIQEKNEVVFLFHGSNIENDYKLASNYNQSILFEKGKKSVIKAFLYIAEKEKSKNNINRCKFIVDSDYDEIDDYKEIEILPKEKRKLLVVLPCYSFENYYLSENNIEIVLKHYLPNCDIYINDFNKKFKEFILKISTYCSWKKIVVKNKFHEKYRDKLKKVHQDDGMEYLNRITISNDKVEIDNRFFAFVDLAIEELLENTSENDKKLISLLINSYRLNFIVEPQYIHGKIVLKFLIEYLNQHSKVVVDKYKLYKLSSKLNCPEI
jgi:hypothetical protein